MKNMTTQWFLLLSALALAGCGTSQQAAETDGAPRFPAGAVDPNIGSTTPAPVSGVTVLKYDDAGAPEAGAPVVYNAPTGFIVAESVTAADGKTETVLPDGGDVTVPYGWTGFRSIETVTGASNGMFLSFNTGSVAAPTTEAGMLAVTVPGNFAGTNVVQVESGCGPAAYVYPAYGDVTAYLSIDEQCAMQPISVLATAMSADAQALAFTHALDIQLGTGDVTSVALGAWRTDWAILPVTVNGKVNDTNAVSFNATFLRAGRTFGSASAVAYAGSLEYGMQMPAGFVQGLSSSTTIYGATGGSSIERRTLNLPASIVLNGTDFLSAVTVTSIDLSDATRPTVGWSNSGSTSDAVGIELVMTWRSPTLSSDWYSWRVIAKNSSRNSLKMPILPASASANGPQAAMENFSVTISVHEYDDLAGYAEVAPTLLGSTPTTTAQGERTIRSAFSY